LNSEAGKLLNGRLLLLLAAACSFVIALVHIVIVIIGAPAYRYFGAAELSYLALQGSLVPAAATLLLAAVFAGFGLYALSGAGLIRPLPLLRPALLAIGGIYTLRGLILILDILRLFRGPIYPFRQTVFSALALVIGLMHLFGALQRSDPTRAA
jgi:putative oxidoreductase